MDKTLVGRILVLVAAGIALIDNSVEFTPEMQTTVENAVWIVIGLASGLKIWKRKKG